MSVILTGQGGSSDHPEGWENRGQGLELSEPGGFKEGPCGAEAQTTGDRETVSAAETVVTEA